MASITVSDRRLETTLGSSGGRFTGDILVCLEDPLQMKNEKD